jgi:hypothetical protein
VALVSILFLLSPQRRALGWVLALVGGTMGAIPEIFRKQAPSLGLWWGPLLILAFASIFIYEYFCGDFTGLCAAPAIPPAPALSPTGGPKS